MYVSRFSQSSEWWCTSTPFLVDVSVLVVVVAVILVVVVVVAVIVVGVVVDVRSHTVGSGVFWKVRVASKIDVTALHQLSTSNLTSRQTVVFFSLVASPIAKSGVHVHFEKLQ